MQIKNQMRLSDNSNTQRQLNEAAFHAEMDLKAKQIEQKLEVGEIDIIHLIIHVISVQCDLSQVSAVILHSSISDSLNCYGCSTDFLELL
jgi:hypothetical protein